MRNLNFSREWSITTIAFLVVATIYGCSLTSDASAPNNLGQSSPTVISITEPVSSPTGISIPTFVPLMVTSTPLTTPKTTCSKELVTGYVVSGGDTTPSGLKDGPRRYLYQVKEETGDLVSIAYTSYPPSPAEEALQKIRLNFHAGEIKIGDYIISFGCLDSDAKTLFVKEEGDYIETFPEKP